jgi:hypothetical protein
VTRISSASARSACGRKSRSSERRGADTPADLTLLVQRRDAAGSCVEGRLLSAIPLISLSDSLLTFRFAGSRRSEVGSSRSTPLLTRVRLRTSRAETCWAHADGKTPAASRSLRMSMTLSATSILKRCWMMPPKSENIDVPSRRSSMTLVRLKRPQNQPSS